MKVKLVKLSRKGQIAIPKSFRDRLESPFLEMDMEENKIVLKPVPSVLSLGGALKKYTRGGSGVKEKKAWGEHVKGKYRRP